MWRCNKTSIAPDESIFILCQFNMLQNIEWRGTKERSYRNCIHGHDDWILLIHTRCSMKSKLYAFNDFFLFAFFLFFFSFFLFVVCMVECKQIEVRLSNQLMLTPNHPPFIWTTLETNTEKLLHWSNHNSCSRLKNTGCNPFFLFFSVHIQYFPFIVVFLLWKTKDLFLLFSSFFSVNKKKHNRRAN